MTLVLIRNANVYAPKPLGTQHLLIGGSRILWMGNESLELPVPLRKVSKIIDAAGIPYSCPTSAAIAIHHGGHHHGRRAARH